MGQQFSIRPFDTNGLFQSNASAHGAAMRERAVRSVGVTLLSGGFTLAIQIISTVVLARLLAPSDFGVVAMVTTFSVLIVGVGQMGIPEAIVQREKVDHRLASNLFWINVAGGVVLTAAFAGAGSILARLYHDVRVAHVAAGTSLTILLTSVSVVHIALLQKSMRFAAVSGNDIVARAISVAVAVGFGIRGFGYWALVAGAVALPLCQSIGVWILCRWLPGLPRRQIDGTGSVVKFAVNTYGRFGLNYVTRNTDNLLIGARFSALELGLYKKAYDLFSLSANQFVHSLTIVFVSALSRVEKHSEEYRKNLLSTLTVMALFGMGLAANLTLIGTDLIRVLLGPGWEESGKIFMFFGPGIGAMIVYHTHGWIHLSLGRADRWFKWGFVEFAVTVSLFFVGVHWGPPGVAIAWTVSFWLLLLPAIAYAGSPIGFGVGAFVNAIWRYVVASCVAGVLTAWAVQNSTALYRLSGVPGAALRVVAVSVVLYLLYFVSVIVLHGSFEPIYQVVGLLRDMLPWKRGGVGFSEAGDGTGAEMGRDLLFRSQSEELPKVSILIPAYNSEEWIAATIRSALGQTWPNKEIIVVDDGSKDNTLAVARQFESAQVRVVTQVNQGASAARNAAFSMSHGEYIQWLDADDILAPDKIEKQMQLVTQGIGERTLISGPWGQFWHRPYRSRFKPTSLWCDLKPGDFLLRKMGDGVFLQTSTWLVSRKLTELAGPWSTALSVDDDGEYFCRVLRVSDDVRFVPESKVFYRYSGAHGLSYIGQNDRKLESLWRSVQVHIDSMLAMDTSAAAKAACVEFLQTNLIYFYPTRKDIVEKLQAMAHGLGGRLVEPQLDWKFAWLKTLCGWKVATHAQLFLPHIMCSMIRSWDKVMFNIDSRRPATKSGVKLEVSHTLYES